MSKYEYPTALQSHCFPEHNPRWNRVLPTRPGFIGASLVVGAGFTFLVQKLVLNPLFIGPVPKTVSRDWQQATREREKNLRLNPISTHKIGQKVPYDI